MSTPAQTIEQIMNGHLNDCLKEAMTKFVGTPYSSSNPMLRIFESVVSENETLIRAAFSVSIRDAFNSEEFTNELRQQVMKKMAQTIVSQTSGLMDKQLNQLKQDPVFKARMTMLIAQTLNPEQPCPTQP